MQLVSIAVTHRSAPINVRERLAFAGGDLGDALRSLGTVARERLILSTCHRTEIYAVTGHGAHGIRMLAAWLADVRPMAGVELESLLETGAHDEAARRLFRVAGGLDSVVVGEDQILAQLRGAIAAARAAGALGPILSSVGAQALAVGKAVRAGTGIGRGSVSLVSLAIRHASQRLDGLAGRRALIVGAGATARLAARRLRGSGIERLTICNRTVSRAEALATELDATAIGLEQLPEAAASSDLVLMAVAAPEMLLTRSSLSPSRSGAPGRRVVVDLSHPRSVQPDVGDMDGVELIDLDTLARVSADTRSLRQAEAQAGEAMIEDAVTAFLEAWRAREVVPTIRALLAHVDGVREREVQRTLKELPHLDGSSRDAVRLLTTRLVTQLLHGPLRALKEDPEGANLAAAIQRLFSLSPESAPDVRPPGPRIAPSIAEPVAEPVAEPLAGATHR